MRDKVNIAEKLAGVTEYFRPKIVASLNEMKVEVVKVRGEFVWHAHPDTDDFFLVLDGELTVELDGTVYRLQAGDLISYNSTRAHRIWNYSRRDAKALWFNVQGGNLLNGRAAAQRQPRRAKAASRSTRG